MVVALAAVAILIPLELRPLLLWDEAIYCGTTQDMLTHGQYLFPTENGVFRWEHGKPALVNWLHMLSTSTFGWSVFTLRLPTALSMVAFMGLLWETGRRLGGGPWVAAVAASLALTSPHLLDTAGQIWLEDLIAPLFAAGLLAYAQGVEANNKRRASFAWVAIAGMAFAIAILTKQAFGGFGLAAVLATELVMRRDGWLARIVLVVATSLFLSSWWFIVTWAMVGEPAIDSWFGYHIAARFVRVLEGHARLRTSYAASLDYYVGTLPWVIGVIGWVTIYKALQRDSDRFLHLAWSALFVIEYLVVGVAIKTFLRWYQVVVVLPLFIGAAFLLVEAWKTKEPKWLCWLLPAVVAAAVSKAARFDPLLILATLSAVILIGQYSALRLPLRLSNPTILVVLAAACAIVIANPFRNRHYALEAARQVSEPSRALVVSPVPELRRWRCYLPKAERLPWEGSCDTIANRALHHSEIVLEGDATQCRPDGFTAVFSRVPKRNMALAVLARPRPSQTGPPVP